jgi:hypothetical protein
MTNHSSQSNNNFCIGFIITSIQFEGKSIYDQSFLLQPVRVTVTSVLGSSSIQNHFWNQPAVRPSFMSHIHS